MARKFPTRYQTFSDINFKNHYLEGFVWTVTSSRTNEEYEITLHDKGFSCTCIAGSVRGKCKHAQHVHDLLVDDDVPQYKII